MDVYCVFTTSVFTASVFTTSVYCVFCLGEWMYTVYFQVNYTYHRTFALINHPINPEISPKKILLVFKNECIKRVARTELLATDR